jgi:hypothetical protein
MPRKKPSPARAEFRTISYSATNPDQWVTLYSDGTVRIHVRSQAQPRKYQFRTLEYRPQRISDREAIARLIQHLNLAAMGQEGEECEYCFT